MPARAGTNNVTYGSPEDELWSASVYAHFQIVALQVAVRDLQGMQRSDHREEIFGGGPENFGSFEVLLERLQTENKLLPELRRLDLLKKYGPSAETVSAETGWEQ